MQIGKYLEKYQPVIYHTFLNEFQNKRLSHAYLISGTSGTPIFEVAKHLAKTILCDDPSPLACNSCITCMRIDDDNYPDMIIIDGSKETIKKGQVETIENRFQKTAFEEKGIMIYILNSVENMTVEAINAILKFLEEPTSEIYAFLTTNNENAILPTILSRCQILRLKLIDREQIIKEAIEDGVANKDAEILSYLFNSADLIANFLKDESEIKTYKQVVNMFEGLLDELSKSDSKSGIFYMQNSIIPTLSKDKNSARLLLSIISMALEDILAIKYKQVPFLKSYDKILAGLSETLPHLNQSLIEVTKLKNTINLPSINIALLLDHLIIELTKE